MTMHGGDEIVEEMYRNGHVAAHAPPAHSTGPERPLPAKPKAASTAPARRPKHSREQRLLLALARLLAARLR